MSNILKIVFTILFIVSIGSCEKSTNSSTSSSTNSSTSSLESIPLILPKPSFPGTPKNLPPGTHIKIVGDYSPRKLFFAPKGVKNVAFKKKVISSDMEPIMGTLDLITDGEKEANEYSFVELGPGVQWVQIDLGLQHNIYAIVSWHEHTDPRVYKDVIIQVSNDKDFITDVRTIFNNDVDNSVGLGIGEDWEFFETHEGQLIDCKGITARYIRTYSNGNTVDDLNRYSEIEAYALPCELNNKEEK